MSRREILVVLDLNGTLLDRIEREERKIAKLNPTLPSMPDMRLNQRHIYLRPYLDQLIDALHEQFHVAAWTSAIPMNADAMVQVIFGGKSLEFSWNREKCELVGNGREHVSIKNLNKIWQDEFTSQNGRWNEKNTIIIDDSPSKSVYNPLNSIHIPTFKVTEPTCNVSKDVTLIQVQGYMTKLVDWLNQTSDADVREFLSKHPLYTQQDGNWTLNYSHDFISSQFPANRRDVPGFTTLQVNNRKLYPKE